MNGTCAALLADPHPCGHILYPYTDENLVSHAVGLFASSGLRKGESVILIMTKSHCEPISGRLEAEGFDVAALQNTGQLVCFVAEDLLSKFLVDGILQEDLFKRVIELAIRRARKGAGNGRQSVRIFGEMVSLMRNSNLAATIRLEELWNQVVDAYAVSLLCTYDLLGTAHEAFPQSLIAAHSRNLASPG